MAGLLRRGCNWGALHTAGGGGGGGGTVFPLYVFAACVFKMNVRINESRIAPAAQFRSGQSK